MNLSSVKITEEFRGRIWESTLQFPLDKRVFQLYHNIMKLLNLHLVEEKLLELNIKIFTPAEFKVIFGVSKRAVQGFLNYNTKKGAFVHLRKGLYGLKRSPPNEFVLANRAYSPSYLSLDSALAYYNLIPETVYSITSVTTRPTREFKMNNLAYKYRKIKKEAFTGYEPKKIGGQIIYIAVPEKAVADFLYFVSLGKQTFNDRLKIEEINKTKLFQYLKLFKQKRLIAFANRFLKNDR